MRNCTIWAAIVTAVLLLLTTLSAFATETKSPVGTEQVSQIQPVANNVIVSSDQDITMSLELNKADSNMPSPEPAQATKPNASSSGSPQKSSDPVARAKKGIEDLACNYLGTPYRWGGTTPKAFDCSGFTKYVYSKLGVRLPRTAREQYRAGTPVKRGQWQAGDLVFFNMNKGYVSHVGMYLGEYAFIHASTPRTGVRIDSLKTKTFTKHYVGARRYQTA